MPNKAKLSLIVVLLASAGAALLAQSGGDGPRDGNSRNLAGRPAAGDRPALAISEQEETAFLRALAEKRPEQANALIKLKNENPREYRVRLTEAYRTYQSWKDMPPEIQKAHEDQVAAKVEAWRTSRELLNATDPAAKERIRTRLQEILGREFDADRDHPRAPAEPVGGPDQAAPRGAERPLGAAGPGDRAVAAGPPGDEVPSQARRRAASPGRRGRSPPAYFDARLSPGGVSLAPGCLPGTTGSLLVWVPPVARRRRAQTATGETPVVPPFGFPLTPSPRVE